MSDSFNNALAQAEASTTASNAANDGRGIACILIGELLMALVNTIVKYVQAWSTQKKMMVRNSVDLCLCMAAWAFFRYEVPGLKVVSLCLVRGMCYVLFLCFFWASLSSCLPLGDVISLVMCFSPLVLVILARVLLGEKIPKMWPLQFVLCSFGVLLINKPMTQNQECPATTALLPLAAAFLGAFMNLASRNLKGVPPPVLCVHNDIVALIYATASQAMNSDEDAILPQSVDRNFMLMAVAAVIGCAGLVSQITGYQTVSVAATASIAAYISIPLSYTIQVVFFDEGLDKFSVAGATLIVCTNVYAIVSKLAAEKKETLEQVQLRDQLPPAEEVGSCPGVPSCC